MSDNNLMQSNVKKSVVHIDGKDFEVISIFTGTETASKLIYDLAVKRILNEGNPK